MMDCPIWKTSARLVTDVPERNITLVESPRAGGCYWRDGSSEWIYEKPDEQTKALLTTLLIDQREAGQKEPELWRYTIEEVKGRRLLSVDERANRVLEYIARQSRYVGHKLAEDRLDTDYLQPLLAWSESMLPTSDEHQPREEILFFTDYLAANDWLFREANRIHVTVSGFTHLAELEHKVVPSTKAFVAMWFDKSVSDAYFEGIKPAIEDCGYESVRVDRIEHTGKIDDRIIAELRKSRFVVADFTQGRGGARGGVYYEAGFAHALGIPVIFTCRKDCMKHLHFDTRQFNHIDWKDTQDLRERLSVRINAVVI